MDMHRQRRARNACKWCHQQRVRCDISRTGAPCTRCSQDGEECEIWKNDSRTEKSSRKDRMKRKRLETLKCSTADDSRKPYSTSAAKSLTPLENSGGPLDNTHDTRTEGNISGQVSSSEYPFLRFSPSGSSGKEEIEYLEHRGCFRIPAQPALDVFVRMYFIHVHPYSPVLIEADFWRIYRHGPSAHERSMSLFVFQALLFVCSAYVELNVVKQCGFPSKLAARKEFYCRAKLLLDLDAEEDELDKSRGALLLSYQASSDNPQIGSLMLGTAIENYTIAEKTGSTSHVSMNTPRLRRLWWSIVLRDGFISLAFRRSAQIGWSDPNLKAQFPNEKDFEDDIAHSEVYDEATKRFLVRIFERQYQFAVIVIEMMSAFFPQKYQCSFESVEELSRALKEIKDVRYAFSFWERGSHEALSPELETWPESVLGITNMTRAYYFTARIHLIHCEAFILQSNRSISTEENIMQMRKSTPDLRHAVTEVHQVMAYMSDTQKRETIPLSMLALMAWPLAIAAIDVNLARTHEDTVQRTEKMSCLGEIYRHFTSVADVTSFVTTGAKQILHLANMTVHQLLLRDQALSPTPIFHCQNSADQPSEFKDDPMGTRNHTLVDWVEVFNHYPEVYLLISKSTDYALSWGRLPDYDKIPGCLLQSRGLGDMNLRLPWVMSLDGEDNTRIQPSDSLDGSSSQVYQQKAGPTAHDFTTIDPSEGMLGYQQTPESFHPSQNDKDQRNAQNRSQSFEGWLSSDFGIPDMSRNTDLEEPFEEFDRYAQPQEIDFNLREEEFSEAFQSSFMSADGHNGYGPFDFRDAYFEPELWSGF